jgi:diguanylate cyclase (GGDEF)-like protein
MVQAQKMLALISRWRDASPLKRLILLTASFLALFAATLLAVIAYAGWSANETAVERERMLVENALNRSIARNLDEQKSIAWWDDAVLHTRKGKMDLDFLDANFGYFLTETYGHQEVYILDEQDQPIYAFTDEARQHPEIYGIHKSDLETIVSGARRLSTIQLRKRPDLFDRGNQGYKFLAGALTKASWSGHIIMVGGKPAVASAITILPNQDLSLMPETPKLLVSVRYIDDAFFGEIGRSLLLPELVLTNKKARAPGMVSEPFQTDDYKLSGVLQWQTKQPGRPILNLILPLTALGLLAAAAHFAVMFRRLQAASKDLADREANAQFAARHDDLSGLPNRLYFSERLTASLSPSEFKTVLFAYIDVDRFKDVNDTLGHRAGDALIQSVATRLRSALASDDLLARFGGDEFAVLRASSEVGEAERLLKRIETAFDDMYEIESQLIRITASVGLAHAAPGGISADELMRRADIALYRAKSQGRDQAVIFSREMGQEVEERRAIELDLRKAIKAGDQLTLHYQPVVSASSQEIIGAEALLRWNHPTRGNIAPGTFVPIAEDSGLMPVLGEWILDQSLRDARRWPTLEIAINLSPVQIRHMDLPAVLRRLLARHEVNPSRIVLEITEGVLLENNERSQQTLTEVRKMGFKTSLDDFGTGYSSLAYLCRFEFDKIKIDRSFITGQTRNAASRTIIQAVATLGRGLGLSVVAEGVETEADALMIKHLGCTEMQGYLFSKAITADAFDKMLADAAKEPVVTVPGSRLPADLRRAK